MESGAPPVGPQLALTRELRTLALVALAGLTILVASAELLCRVPAVQARLPTPSYGITPAFDVLLARLP